MTLEDSGSSSNSSVLGLHIILQVSTGHPGSRFHCTMDTSEGKETWPRGRLDESGPDVSAQRL